MANVIKLAKANAKKLLVWAFNGLLSAAFFFFARRFLLRLTGCHIGSDVTIHRKVCLFSFGKLVVGSGSTINRGCYLDNRFPISIGRNVNLSHDVRIYTLGHDIDSIGCDLKGGSVTIEDYVWVFPNVLIMPGVCLGEGSVVYPGSVITKDLPAYAIVGGNPARVIRMRKRVAYKKAVFPLWFGV